MISFLITQFHAVPHSIKNRQYPACSPRRDLWLLMKTVWLLELFWPFSLEHFHDTASTIQRTYKWAKVQGNWVKAHSNHWSTTSRKSFAHFHNQSRSTLPLNGQSDPYWCALSGPFSSDPSSNGPWSFRASNDSSWNFFCKCQMKILDSRVDINRITTIWYILYR